MLLVIVPVWTNQVIMGAWLFAHSNQTSNAAGKPTQHLRSSFSVSWVSVCGLMLCGCGRHFNYSSTFGPGPAAHGSFSRVPSSGQWSSQAWQMVSQPSRGENRWEDGRL